MPRILINSVVGALVSLALLVPLGASGASSAPSAPPSSVFIRIEGASTTLVTQTLVQTTTASTLRGEACPGSSAAAALTIATHGNWSGKWFPSLKDFQVNSILGEAPTGSSFWTLWLNGRSSTTGGCGTTLHTGDRVLWFDCQSGPAPAFACTNNPLSLTAPATTRRGRPVTVTVSQLDGNGHSTPLAGAAITGGGVVAVSGADGTATFVPQGTGVIRLHAVKSGATPSDVEFVCVYARRASQCGSVGKRGPRTHVVGIRENQVFLGQGPRLLHGTAGPDPSGITDVRLSLFRRAPNGRCSYYDASAGRWHRKGCLAAAPHASFSVGANASWSYLLPHALALGSYRLNVTATDASGRHAKPVLGRSAINFAVRP